jgi:sulfofructose kinase
MVTVDLIAVVDHFPLPGRKDPARAVEVAPGGPAFVASTLLRKLGQELSFLGLVGRDTWGEFLLGEMDRMGMDRSCLRVGAPGATTLASVWVETTSGRRTVLWKSPSAKPGGAAPADLRLLDGAQLLYLDGHCLSLALPMAREARRLGLPVLLDAGSRKEGQEELLEHVTHLIGSERFWFQCFPDKTDEEAIGELYSQFPHMQLVAFTLGERGVVASDGNPVIRLPAEPVRAVDTNGAGDIFHGAYAYALLAGWPLEEALRFSCKMAGKACESIGNKTFLEQAGEFARQSRSKNR